MTTWNYDAYQGLPSGKTYDGGTYGPSYTYTPAGRLHTLAQSISSSIRLLQKLSCARFNREPRYLLKGVNP